MKFGNATAWENEYRNPKFLALGTEPLSDVKDFMKWVKKLVRQNPQDFAAPISEWKALDLGCGNGKNLHYLVENYVASGVGYDISRTAIEIAHKRADGLLIDYSVRSIGEVCPLENQSIDLVLDVTSSNSLNESERSILLGEIARVLKPSGYVFVRALCKDGDTNAKNLIKQFPGQEYDTYTLGTTGITERVFSKEDFEKTYADFFEIVYLEKTSGYQKWGNQSYKRNYWIAYLKLKKK